MLNTKTIQERLERMAHSADPGILWDETCEGSACALVVFVGPSPGGAKATNRLALRKKFNPAYWDTPYDAPLSWGPGFRASFDHTVEALFAMPFGQAAKLVGRANMDWISNPNSDDVPARYMWEGRGSVLEMIETAQPEVVIAWDRKTCLVLEITLFDAGFTLSSVEAPDFIVRVSNAMKSRYNRGLLAFKACSPKGHDFVVLKTPQHPSRIFDADYASRCGEALRRAAQQIVSNKPVKVSCV